jgi:hypothetical protein
MREATQQLPIDYHGQRTSRGTIGPEIHRHLAPPRLPAKTCATTRRPASSLRGPGFQHNRMANINGIIFGARFLESPRELIDAFWEALQRMDRERRSVRKLEVKLSVKVPRRFVLAQTTFRTLRDIGSYLRE